MYQRHSIFLQIMLTVCFIVVSSSHQEHSAMTKMASSLQQLVRRPSVSVPVSRSPSSLVWNSPINLSSIFRAVLFFNDENRLNIFLVIVQLLLTATPPSTTCLCAVTHSSWSNAYLKSRAPYCKDGVFISRTGQRLSWFRSFAVLLSSYRQFLGYCLKLSHDHFLLNLFQFTRVLTDHAITWLLHTLSYGKCRWIRWTRGLHDCFFKIMSST